MNNVMKSISSLMLCAAVIVPVFGMDSESIQTAQSSVVATQSKLTFEDACVIEHLSDGTILINDKGENLTFTDLDKPHFKGETGEDVVEYSGLATDKNQERSWAKAFFEPEGFSPAHFHAERTEDYYITSENARVRVVIDGTSYDLSTGDHIRILPNQVHKVLNLSKENELSLFCKCSPSWAFHDHQLTLG